MNQHYLTDALGNRVGVILALDEYERLLEAAEDLASIQAYDEAKAVVDDVPLEQAIAEIQQTKCGES
jgi:ferric-dicitrate binding protein FerR (iron transport regulator)